MASIFKDIFKNKKEIDLYSKIEDITKKLPPARNNSKSEDDYLNKIISDEYEKDSQKNNPRNEELSGEAENVFKDITVPNERIDKYKTYDDIYKNVQIVKKIVSVYLNYVFNRDPVNSRIFNIVDNVQNSNKSDSKEKYKNFVNSVISYFDIEDKLRNIVGFDMLKYGDSFLELINVEKVEVDFPKVEKDKNSKNNSEDIISGVMEFNQSPQEIQNDLELVNEFDFFDGIDYKKTKGLEKIVLKFHKPKNIVPIYNDNDYIFGYIEIKESDNKGEKYNNLREFVNTVNDMTGYDKSKGENYDESLKKLSSKMVERILEKNNIFFFQKNNEDAEKAKMKYNQKVKNTLDETVYNSLKKILILSDKDILKTGKVNVRFIEKKNMYHFRTNNVETYPFGQSIIDPMVYPAKLYLLTQLSHFMTTLSNSSQIRKWSIDIGSRQDSSSLLQKLKTQLKNNTVTASDLSTSRNIVNMMSEYKDLVTFKKKGQTFIDVDSMEFNRGRENHTRELEEIRKELVAVSGVPSSYLGFTDMGDLREELIHVNVNFATETSAIQHNINNNLSRLIDHIASEVNFGTEGRPSEFIKINLIPPMILMLQSLENATNTIGQINRSLRDDFKLDIDPTYMLKLFSQYIDWDNFIQSGQNWKIKTDTQKGEDDDSGGGW